MSVLLCRPQPFTIISADDSALFEGGNLNLDHPGFVWRSPSSVNASVIVQGAGQLVDTVALVGSNLAPGDTFYVRFSADRASLDAAPWARITGVSSVGEGFTNKTIVHLDAPVSFGVCQIYITSGSAKVFSGQRLVIGRAIVHAGIESDPEQGFTDRSVGLSGPGWVGFQEFATVPTWKAACSFIPADIWKVSWLPFLAWAGVKKPFLFVPSLETSIPEEITFARLDSAGKGSTPGGSVWRVEMNMTGVSL